jgi:hypothetical protein
LTLIEASPRGLTPKGSDPGLSLYAAALRASLATPSKRADGLAGRPLTPKAWIRAALNRLRRSAFYCLFVEQAPTAGADLALDVIGNTGSLADSVHGDGVVLMTLEGHSLSSG